MTNLGAHTMSTWMDTFSQKIVMYTAVLTNPKKCASLGLSRQNPIRN